MPYFTLRKSMAVAAVTELVEVVEATIEKVKWLPNLHNA
jgi:hypothetical protein